MPIGLFTPVQEWCGYWINDIYQRAFLNIA